MTGPTGSGKSTTFAAMIDYINQTVCKSILLHLKIRLNIYINIKNLLFNQREVGVDTNNFANGLRAALRQDPDIILSRGNA